MRLLVEDLELEAYESLYSDRPTRLPAFVSGASLPLEIGRLKRIVSLYDSKIFEPQAVSGWTMRAAIGGGFNLPVAGNWPITFLASDNVTSYSSDWIIPYNPSADDIQNALNGLTGISAIGGVIATGREGFFQITFNNVGVRNLLSGNAARLSPLSLLVFQRAVTGDSSTQEVQTLRILQNAGAIASLTADTVSTTISQADIVVGSGSANAKIRVTLPADRYGGTWSFTKGATTADNLGYDDNAAQLETALATAFGSGKITVSQYSADSYDFTFIGTFGLQAITITLSGAALLVLPTFSGELDLSGVGVDLLFNGSGNSIITSLEIEGTPSSGNTRKLFQADVQLRRPVVTPSSSATTGTQSVEDYSGSETDGAIAGTTSVTLAPAKRFLQWFKLYTVAAGSGTYTANIGLDGSKAVRGAIYRVELDIAATGNPTVNIRDGSSSGTIIDTIPGDSNGASYYVGEYRWTGTAWKKLRGTFQT